MENNLFKALATVFTEFDALLLANFLEGGLDAEIIRYGRIHMPENRKRDLVLLAFEERILIPARSRNGPAWEDRVIEFGDETPYFIPPVARAVLDTMRRDGTVRCEEAARGTLRREAGEGAGGLVRLLRMIMGHAGNRMFEAGLPELLCRQQDAGIDLHDALDIFVVCGMMSPCPRKSLMTGLSWYEINSVLYWDQTFPGMQGRPAGRP